MTEKICPLVKGECIGTQCMACKPHTNIFLVEGVREVETRYTCKIFDTKLDIKENEE